MDLVEYFPLLVFEETTVSKNWKAFCLSVNEISGHIWVNGALVVRGNVTIKTVSTNHNY